MPTTNVTLQVQPGTDALHRVVCICHRRNLQILMLIYVQQEITLKVTGPELQVRGLERWLSALLHVLEVQRADC